MLVYPVEKTWKKSEISWKKPDQCIKSHPTVTPCPSVRYFVSSFFLGILTIHVPGERIKKLSLELQLLGLWILHLSHNPSHLVPLCYKFFYGFINIGAFWVFFLSLSWTTDLASTILQNCWLLYSSINSNTVCIEFSLKYFCYDCGVQLPIQMLILIAVSSSLMLQSRKIYY